MQHKHLQFGHGFKGVLGDEHSQAAQMTLAPGETEGGPDNWHRGADQWLFVVSGTGEAVLPRHERSSLARSVSEGMSYRSPSLTLRVSVTIFPAGVITREGIPSRGSPLKISPVTQVNLSTLPPAFFTPKRVLCTLPGEAWQPLGGNPDKLSRLAWPHSIARGPGLPVR